MPKVFVYNNPKRRIPKSVYYTVGGIVVIALVTWGIVAFAMHKNKEKKSAQQLSIALSDANKTQSPFANANLQKETLSQLIAALPAAKTNKQKSQIYYDLALSYETNGNPQEAIHYMLLRSQLDPSSAGSNELFLAEAYQRLGENAQAIAAYKGDITYVQHDNQLSSWSKSYEIENDNGIIQSLETGQ